MSTTWAQTLTASTIHSLHKILFWNYIVHPGIDKSYELGISLMKMFNQQEGDSNIKSSNYHYYHKYLLHIGAYK